MPFLPRSNTVLVFSVPIKKTCRQRQIAGKRIKGIEMKGTWALVTLGMVIAPAHWLFAYPVPITFTINAAQSSLTVNASSSIFQDSDTKGLSGTIDGAFDFGESGVFPSTANLTITSADIRPSDAFQLRLGFPRPFPGSDITASNLVADLSTPAPPATMTRSGTTGTSYQFDASQFLVTVDQGTIVVSGTTNETTDLSQEPVMGASPPGTFGTLTFTNLGMSGPYTRLGAALDFPIRITDTAESETGGESVELELIGNVRANASFYVALAGLPGDFDEDGDVDGADLPLWRAGFGMAASAAPANGDADRDGDADGHDFLIWQRNLGTTPPAAATTLAATVPEPIGFVMGGAAVVLLATASRRRCPLHSAS
jgi:hypothetical protein